MQTEIKIKVTLDDNRVPEKLAWTAPDGGIEAEETKALMLSVWDDKAKEALRIDLWTKEMPVDEMKRFIHQVLHTLSVTYEKATNEEDVALEISKFAEDFAVKAGIKM